MEVPPDPRTSFEKRSQFVETFFSPPCFTDLEKFFKNNKQKKNQAWNEDELNSRLDQMAKMKKPPNPQKLEKLKFQLMLSYMNDARKGQLKR